MFGIRGYVSLNTWDLDFTLISKQTFYSQRKQNLEIERESFKGGCGYSLILCPSFSGSWVTILIIFTVNREQIWIQTWNYNSHSLAHFWGNLTHSIETIVVISRDLHQFVLSVRWFKERNFILPVYFSHLICLIYFLN